MRTLFADTFYYIALLSPTDSAHPRAVEFTRTYNELMVTTAWIITELADGMADAKYAPGFHKFLRRSASRSTGFSNPTGTVLFR